MSGATGSAEHEPMATQRASMERQPASRDVANAAALGHGDGTIVDRVLRVGSGVTEDEVPAIRESLEGLSALLAPLDDGTLEIELWLRKRNTSDQVTYLAVRAKDVDLVAHSTMASLDEAMAELKRRMRRQLSDRHDRRTERRR